MVTEHEYARRVAIAIDFLEARSIAPLDRVIREMTAASEHNEFESAVLWRNKLDQLEWLLATTVKARAAIEALSFVYDDPGVYGDDRVYVIRRATVRAAAPTPRTPIEREAFKALVSEHVALETMAGPLPPTAIDETVLLTSWFRRHPQALRRTVPLADWHKVNTSPQE
jgi:excinuclease UvrABC nuclease subunit